MFTKETYTLRRSGLIAKMKEQGLSGIALLLGNDEASKNYPSNQYAMRQDSTFLYYFGLRRAGFAAIVDIDSGEVTLCGDDYTLDDMIWMGVQPSVADDAASIGVEKSAPYSAIGTTVASALNLGRSVHYLPPYRADNRQFIAELLGVKYSEVAAGASEGLIKAVVAQREIKDAGEIEQIEMACAIGNRMHRTAMQMCKVGATEQSIAGAIEGIALEEGSGVSFHSIVSQHGETLHNHNHSGILTEGRLLLVDAGAENNMNYCSDHTRTYPASGVFTDKQKLIYEIVERGLRLGMAMARPGITYQSVQREVTYSMVRDLSAAGLLRGDVDAAVEKGVLGLLMPHGLGHQMGLDVHDMEDLGERFVGYNELTERSTVPGMASLRMGKTLYEGHVVTVEPGIYFVPALIDKWESEGTWREFVNFEEVRKFIGFGGIRLENDILITSSGARELGVESAPLGVKAVEDFMRG